MKNTVNFRGKAYADRRIKSLQSATSASLDLRTMEVDTAELTLDVAPIVMGLMTADLQPIYTADGYRLCVAEDGGFSAWSQADPLTLSRGGSQYAIWYPRQVKPLPGNYVSISATSPLARLTQMEHRGGIYTGREAGGLIREICGDVEVYISGVFEHVPLYGYLPYVSPSGLPSAIKGSAKDNLLKVLFALNASLRVSAEGVLRVESLGTEITSSLDRSRVYRENAALQEDTPITSVTVLEHQYIAGTDTVSLFEGTTTAGQIVIFREPCSDLTATGFTILSSGANWAELSAGTGTLTGAPYIHITREVTRAVTASNVENAVRIEDATLVGLTNSSDVADRMAAYYAHRTRILVDAVVEFERPGDVVSAWDPVAKLMREACIEKMSPLNVSKTMKAKLSLLVGFTPWQQQAFVDVRVVITAGTSYTFPADILPGTSVEAVLIGGGDGGLDGAPGGNGGSAHAERMYSSTETGSVETSLQKGGDGGDGGAAGSGGKVLRITVTADPGQTFQLAIGEGGAANGGKGGATLFGGYSSENGAASPIGYYDPVTQEIFAPPGEDGTRGGDGGDGGAATTSYEYKYGGDGENVGQYIGGRGGRSYYRGVSGNWSESSAGGGGSGATATGNGVDAVPGIEDKSVGANGVTPSARSTPTVYGAGGHGGHGGSGGGGCGAMYYRQNVQPGTFFRVILDGVGGIGGLGGVSSAGMQGLIVLYFRKPVEAE